MSIKSTPKTRKSRNNSVKSDNNLLKCLECNQMFSPKDSAKHNNRVCSLNGPLPRSPVQLSDIAGYETQINSLKDIIELPLIHRSKIEKMSIALPRSALLFGPSGTGKTMTMRAIINEFSQQMNCVDINCGFILSKTFGESDNKLRNVFTNAIESSPSLIFLDNIDIIYSNKRTVTDQEKRLMSTLTELLDDLPNDKHIIIIAATNKPDSLDGGLRRPGRLDKEIEFAVPLPSERFAILRKHLNDNNCDINDEKLVSLSESAHSFTGADLVLICRESALNAIKDNREMICETDVKRALKFVRPSAMREISLEVPNVYWDEIGGMKEVRKRLVQSVVWPLKNPEAFERVGIEAPRGVLMYGPPGCCKTMIGKALATESGLNFLAIKGPELFSKWVGESERAVREVFRKAKAASPSILFFDEIDALAAERGVTQSSVGDRVLAQILTEIDGIEKLKGVIIVAATNRPDMIDKALLRPGRLDSIIYVPLPDSQTRFEIFTIRTRNMPLKFTESLQQTLLSLAQKTDGYTGAEITAICQEAGLLALEHDINCTEVDLTHFLSALESVKPGISADMISFYDSYKTKCNQILKNNQ